jgi:capsular exopolysaccharide synthesis family protein
VEREAGAASEQRLATILWRGKYLIAVAVAVAVVLAIVLTRLSSKVYAASAVLQVNAATASPSSTDPLGTQQASEGLAATYARRLVDRSFLAQIQPRVQGGRLTTGQLQNRISASAVKGTTLIELTAEGPSPSTAKSLAAQVANGFVGTIQQESRARTLQLQQEIETRISALNKRIEQLASGTQSPAAVEQLAALRGARTALVQQEQGLFANGLQQGGVVSVTAPPSGSAAPVRPRPVLNIVAGVLLGLLVGIGLSLLRARLDRGLHSAREVEQILGTPVLASIPLRRRFSSDDPVLGEAYDILRANLAFLSLDHPIQVVTFTSFNPGEGKSSTAEGLAYAAVRGGLNVLLVDGDARTRTLSQRLGYADAPGLTTVTVDLATPEEAIAELADGLSFLPAGPTPPNPPSLLSSQRVVELVSHLRSEFSLIIFDSPPVAHLADASILASVSDGVVLIARVGVTQRVDLTAAAANLRHSPTPIVGVVVLEPREVDQTYYPAITRGTAPALPDTSVSP